MPPGRGGMALQLRWVGEDELDRVADYLVVLSAGEVRLDGETDDVLARHRVLTGPATEADAYAGQFHVVPCTGCSSVRKGTELITRAGCIASTRFCAPGRARGSLSTSAPIE